MVGIGAPERRLAQYPHELSGGLRQRAMIAMAIACRPALLIADEPTTALDVTIQAQILDLIKRLQREMGMSVLLITHDLGIVAEVCERVIVMYAGRIVERASAAALYRRPRHPYTTGLLASSPRLGDKRPVLPTIPGMVPSPGQRGAGCYFAARCPRALDRCRVEAPPLEESNRITRPPAGTPCHDRAAARRGARQAFPARGGKGTVRAVDGVSFEVHSGETLGIVGESGCGKSTLARTLLRLIKPTAGEIEFDGTDLCALDQRALRAMRREMQMIFQDPFASLDPRLKVGAIVAEPLGHPSHRRPRQPAQGGRRVAGDRRVGCRCRRALPARVLRRAAPAHRHRASARAQAQADHRGRTGLGARRVDPVADPQSARAS